MLIQAQITGNIIKTTDLSMNVNNISIQVDDAEYGTEYATFNSWIYGIMRSGFGTPSMAELNAYTEQLKVVYEKLHTKRWLTIFQFEVQ